MLANIGLVGGFIIWHSNFYQMILVYGVVGTFLLISSILFVIFSKKPKVSDEEVSKELKEMSPSSYQ
jgi:CHASE2 domain-containing sensor protein